MGLDVNFLLRKFEKFELKFLSNGIVFEVCLKNGIVVVKVEMNFLKDDCRIACGHR